MPMMRCILSTGDWLYIPSGYWHQATVASDETAMSLAIGVMPTAAIDVLEFLRPRLLTSMLWRQRLPTASVASQLSREELKVRYRELLDQLSRDLQNCLADENMLDAAIEHFSQKD